jgi:hypothetical protein
MSMMNHQSEKATELIWNDFKFKTGVSDASFSKNSLKRSR